MNRRAMPVTIRPIAAFFPLALAACSLAPSQAPLEEAPLYGATIGGEFELTSETGETVRWSDFDGKWRTVYFGWTYCPDICPTDNQRAMAGLKAFERANPELGSQVQPIFISVDPERDTPEVLAEFTDNFHPRLIGLTGEVEELRAIAADFGGTFSKGEVTENGSYEIGHSSLTILFAPDGQPVAPLPTDLGADAVAEELAKWVR